MSGIEILLSDHRGVYIPRDFAEFDHSISSWGIPEDDSDLVTLRQGPDAEWYWDAWDSVLSRAVFVDARGNRWHLSQDGDLFAYCEALMTDEEYFSFYGHHRDSDLDNDEQSAWYDTSAELK